MATRTVYQRRRLVALSLTVIAAGTLVSGGLLGGDKDAQVDQPGLT